MVSVRTETFDVDHPLPIPQNLELVITAPSGAAQPSVTDKLGGTTTSDSDAHRPVKVAHIPVAGDYTITTNGRVSQLVSPRLLFGRDNPFGYLPLLFAGLCVVSMVAIPVTAIRRWVALRVRRRVQAHHIGPRVAGVGSASPRGSEVVCRHRRNPSQPGQDDEPTGIPRLPLLCAGSGVSVAESGSGGRPQPTTCTAHRGA